MAENKIIKIDQMCHQRVENGMHGRHGEKSKSEPSGLEAKKKIEKKEEEEEEEEEQQQQQEEENRV